MIKIENLYNEYNSKRIQILTNAKYLEEHRNGLTKDKNIDKVRRRLRGNYTSMQMLTFDHKVFWLNSLLKHYEDECLRVSNDLTSQNNAIQSLRSYARLYKYDLPPMKSAIKTTKIYKCFNCENSILPSTIHQSLPNHQSQYINPICKSLPDNTIIAIDVESVNKKKTDYFESAMQAIRIAAVTDCCKLNKISPNPVLFLLVSN